MASRNQTGRLQKDESMKVSFKQAFIASVPCCLFWFLCTIVLAIVFPIVYTAKTTEHTSVDCASFNTIFVPIESRQMLAIACLIRDRETNQIWSLENKCGYECLERERDNYPRFPLSKYDSIPQHGARRVLTESTQYDALQKDPSSDDCATPQVRGLQSAFSQSEGIYAWNATMNYGKDTWKKTDDQYRFTDGASNECYMSAAPDECYPLAQLIDAQAAYVASDDTLFYCCEGNAPPQNMTYSDWDNVLPVESMLDSQCTTRFWMLRSYTGSVIEVGSIPNFTCLNNGWSCSNYPIEKKPLNEYGITTVNYCKDIHSKWWGQIWGSDSNLRNFSECNFRNASAPWVVT